MLERILCEAKFNRAIVEECLRQRDKRMGIDCVHDDVERALCKVAMFASKITIIFPLFESWNITYPSLIRNIYLTYFWLKIFV